MKSENTIFSVVGFMGGIIKAALDAPGMCRRKNFGYMPTSQDAGGKDRSAMRMGKGGSAGGEQR
jgi:hypothetical protein